MDITQFVLLLQEVPGIGDRTLANVLRRNAVLRRAPEEFLALTSDELARGYGIRADAVCHLQGLGPADAARAQEMARALARAGVRVLTLLDATYPAALLKALEEAPPVLHAYGNGAVLRGPLFAAANSNGASEEALRAVDLVAGAALQADWAPVTGHNRPGYQRPALVARRLGGRVCYVLDRGLLEAFNGDLTRELFPAARIWSPVYDPQADLTLSPFGLNAHGIAAHNRRRDDLIFALADLLVAGDVRPGGQMERQCLRALECGKTVLLAGPIREEDSALLLAGGLPVDPEDRDSVTRLLHAARPASP